MIKKPGLRKTLLSVTLLPIVLFGIVIIVCSCKQMEKSVHHEVETGLTSLSQTVTYIYEREYPGDYHLDPATNCVYKGDKQVDQALGIFDDLKKISGADITIFYKDIRIITTLQTKDKQSLVGSKANAVIIRDVLAGNTDRFYSKTRINGVNYFAYYRPLYNEKEECIGMVFVGKPSQYVTSIVMKRVTPIISIIVICLLAMSVIIWNYSARLTKAMQCLQKFLAKAEKGDFTAKLGMEIEERKDELGKIGESAIQMQHSLQQLVELDSLTGLYNRHYGEVWLCKVKEEAELSGAKFCVALADIDFFKKFNDRYGHDCGDLVLQKVSGVFRTHMRHRGYAARWGGEEFLLVFENRGMEKALLVIDEIMQAIRDMKVLYEDQELGVTITIGIVEGIPQTNVDTLIKGADEALYEGKESGRNCIKTGTLVV